MERLPANLLARLVREALLEDIGAGDLTCGAVVPAQARGRGLITAGQRLVLAGVGPARLAFTSIAPEAIVSAMACDGDVLDEGAIVLKVEGRAAAILAAERTALNFLGRMSGIATLARSCVEAAAGTHAEIFDTRKTTPSLRVLERYAVRVGGGRNHRFGLFDAVLIKDNHLVVAGGVAAAVSAARASLGPSVDVEVEVETLEDLEAAIGAGADIVLLDNMSPETMAEAVALRDRLHGGSLPRRPLLEASGGITAAAVRAVARSGVERISMGALTHSAPSANLGLTLQRVSP